MNTRLSSEAINQDQHPLLSTAAIGIAAVAAGTVLATSAFAQSAREVRGPTPYFAVENEPAPKLIVDPALPGPLALGLALPRLPPAAKLHAPALLTQSCYSHPRRAGTDARRRLAPAQRRAHSGE